LKSVRKNPDIETVAVGALSDRAYLVREHACAILAASLNPEVLPSLQAAATHADAQTRADVLAAIDAITHGNLDYYVDRQHTGQSHWRVQLMQ
jgi:hypothetical protein